jgi:hypothetical protein
MDGRMARNCSAKHLVSNHVGSCPPKAGVSDSEKSIEINVDDYMGGTVRIAPRRF